MTKVPDTTEIGSGDDHEPDIIDRLQSVVELYLLGVYPEPEETSEQYGQRILKEIADSMTALGDAQRDVLVLIS